jgi:hypothetical protein
MATRMDASQPRGAQCGAKIPPGRWKHHRRIAGACRMAAAYGVRGQDETRIERRGRRRVVVEGDMPRL